MKIAVALSYFHRKIGPIAFLTYPTSALGNDEKARLADIMDQAFEEGYFTHSLSSYTSCNYYFEIESAFARGNREMLMFSVVLPEAPKSDVEEKIIKICEEFAKKLKDNKNIYKAFYSTEDLKLDEKTINELKENYNLLKLMIKEEYWNVVQETRERTEEEKIAELMKNKSVYNLVKMLEEGVITLNNLQKWFKSMKYGDEKELKKILTALEREKIIFINEIGMETYVLLTKSIKIERVPPDFVITQFLQNKDLYNLYIGTIQEFFNNYKKGEKDELDLFSILADRNCYSIILQLKEGPIAVDTLKQILSDKKEKETLETLEYLKIFNIVREITYNNEKLVVLICLIQLDTQFPNYLNVIIPKSGYLSKAYESKTGKKEYKTTRELLEDYDVEIDAVEGSNTNLEKAPQISEINFEGTIFQGKTLEFKKQITKTDKEKQKEEKMEEIDWAKKDENEEDDRTFITNKLRSLIPEGFFTEDKE